MFVIEIIKKGVSDMKKMIPVLSLTVALVFSMNGAAFAQEKKY